MRKFTVRWLLLLSVITSFAFQANAQCETGQSELYLTTSGGNWLSEKWVQITTEANGAGEVIWAQGDGTYGNGAGLVTDQAFCIQPGTTYYINAYDKFADGWDGTTYQIADAYGNIVANNAGNSPNDNSNDDGSNWGDTQEQELEVSEAFTYTPPTCPACSDLATTGITDTEAILSWTSNGTETAWDIEYGTTPFTPTGTPSFENVSNPYTLTDLDQDTEYQFFVKAVCGTDDESTWTGPFTFSTLESCQSPTVVSATEITPLSANLIWTGNGPATQWDIELGLEDFEPTGTPTRNDITTNPYTYSDLIPETEYDFYIRTDCGGNNVDISKWNGPYSFTTTISCHKPTSLTTNEILAESATLAWVAGDATNYNFVFGFDGFNKEDSTLIALTDTFYTISGLLDNTDYDFYVQGNCGTDDLSTWAGPYSFTTECGFVTPEYTIDFTDGYKPQCWEEKVGILANPSILTGSYSSWTNDGFGNVGSTGAAKLQIYSSTYTPTKKEWLISKTIDLGTSNNYKLEFDLALTGVYTTTTANQTGVDDKFAVVISTDNGETWNLSDTLRMWHNGATKYKYNNIAPDGENIAINLSSYTGLVKIAFYGESTISNADNNVYIDNFVINEIPVCPRPVELAANDITTTTAQLTWTEFGSTTHWDIEFGPVGFEATGTPTVDNTDAIPYLKSDLLPERTYEFYVRADCGENDIDTSPWTGPFEFTTSISCHAPTALTASEITTNTGTMSWTSGDASEFNLVYGIDGFDKEQSTIIILTDTFKTFDNLLDGTDYQFYVQGRCSEVDTSQWVGPYDFTTECGIASPGYLEKFNKISPNCWTQSKGILSDAPTLTGTTSNWTEDGFGNIGTKGSAKLNIYGTSRKDWLISKSIDLGTSNNLQLDFDLAVTDYGSTTPVNTGGIDDKFAVIISTDDGATWSLTNALRIWDNTTSEYVYDAISNIGENVSISLSEYTGIVKIALYGESTVAQTGIDNDLFVDNFRVRETPSCIDPVNMTVSTDLGSSIVLSWLEQGTSESWNVQYGETGFELGSGDIITVTDTFALISDLIGNTTYDFYVQSNCGDNLSPWSTVTTTTTTCDPQNDYPYLHDFLEFLPTCWDEASEGTPTTGPSDFGTGNWASGTSASGSKLAKIALSGISNREWLLSPRFDLSATAYQLEFDLFVANYDWTPDAMGSDDRIILLYTTDEENWDTLRIWSSVDNISNLGSHYIFNLSELASPVRFAIWATDGIVDDDESYNVSIDNFEIRELPNCLAPTYLTASSISNTAATFSWTTGGASNWNVEYGATGFTLGSGTFVELEDTFITLTDLNPETAYHFYVQDSCGNADESEWAGPFTITTLMNPLSNPTACELGFAIPDLGCKNISIDVTGTSATEVLRQINIIVSHTYDGDLDISLISPEGIEVELTTDNGSGSNNYGMIDGSCSQYTSFNMSGINGNITSGSAPFVGSYIPEGDFMDFNTGSGLNGLWEIKICDDGSGDTGAFEFAELIFEEGNTETDILTFTFPNQVGETVINTENHTVVSIVPFAIDKSNITPTYTLSQGASHTQNITDYSSDVAFSVMAESLVDEQAWTITLNNVPPSTEKAILTYSIAEQTQAAVIDNDAHTIDIEVGFSIDLSDLVANFTISDLATVNIAGTAQVSGTTSNPYVLGDALVYSVVAEDGSIQEWSVNITKAEVNTNTSFLTYSIPEQTEAAIINEIDHTVTISMEMCADITELVASFTLDYLAYSKVNVLTQVSGTTANDFTSPVLDTIFAEDESYQVWTITVTQPTGVVSSFPYLEGFETESVNPCFTILNEDADTKEWEIYSTSGFEGEQAIGVGFNSTANDDWLISPPFDINQDNLVLDFYAKSYSSSWLESYNVLISTTGNAPEDFTSVLENAIDVPASWINKVYNLADLGINSGDQIYVAIQCVSENESRLLVDNFSIHEAYSPNAEILTYAIPTQVDATIDSEAATIAVVLPEGTTDFSSLIANFTISEFATIKVGTTDQVSATTENDWSTSNVVYTVTAQDGTSKDWTVSVAAFIPLSDAKEITAYSLDGQTSSEIFAAGDSIQVTFTGLVELDAIVATFTLSENATAKVLTIDQVSGTTPNDWSTSPVIYTVTAEDGTTKDWKVVVNLILSSEAEITTYNISGQITSTIDEANSSILVVMNPIITDVSNRVAEFVLSPGASATVEGIEQESDVTGNDWSTSHVVYTVTAEDGTTRDWKVYIDLTSGMDNKDQNQEITVFPNPNNGLFNVSLNLDNSKISSIEVLNAQGKVVKYLNQFNDHSTQQIDLTDLTEGLYYIRINTLNTRFIKKVNILK